jgi:hypothetical protein
LEEWVAHLVATHRIEPLALQRDTMVLEDLGETQVDVRGDQNRFIRDPSRPALVVGRQAELHVAFTGDPKLLHLRPNTHTYRALIARAEGQEIVKHYRWATDTERPDLKAEAASFADTIEQWMGWSRETVDLYNGELETLARETIQRRRERVIADHTHLDDLGIPVRRRSDAPQTYAAPGIVRRTPPVAKPESPRAPEPTMVGDLYEHTLGLIRSWGKAIERTPGPYADAGEETLRDALLPMLNSHYEGAATGETFNAAGKTDILIRVEDRNVFIGECKWWSGPGAVTDALDQLFSYTTWRDTKLALIFFVDRKNPTAVVEKAHALFGDHDLFIGWNDAGDARELRATMRWPGDDSITAELHIFFVHLPTQT